MERPSLPGIYVTLQPGLISQHHLSLINTARRLSSSKMSFQHLYLSTVINPTLLRYSCLGNRKLGIRPIKTSAATIPKFTFGVHFCPGVTPDRKSWLLKQKLEFVVVATLLTVVLNLGCFCVFLLSSVQAHFCRFEMSVVKWMEWVYIETRQEKCRVQRINGVDFKPVILDIKKSRLRWFGHVECKMMLIASKGYDENHWN